MFATDKKRLTFATLIGKKLKNLRSGRIKLQNQICQQS